jgi:hypothetical protein
MLLIEPVAWRLSIFNTIVLEFCERLWLLSLTAGRNPVYQGRHFPK